jgi:HEAT repeat protein
MDPSTLIVDMSTMPPHDLTFAAERLGAYADRRVRLPLVRLLRHESAVVREGAVLGLYHHATSAHVARALAIVARADPSPAVRGTAVDALEEGR